MKKGFCILLLLSSLRTQAVTEEGEFYWFKRGIGQFEDASYEKAFESFSQALEKADKLQDYSRFFRAKSAIEIKKWEEAQKDLLNISVQESHFKLTLESRLLLANVYFELKKPQLVKPLFIKLLRRVRRTEDEPQVLLTLAKAERLAEAGRGCRYLVELYKRFPDFSEVKHWDADLDKNEFLGEPTQCSYDIEDFRSRMRALLWAGLDQKAYSEMILVAGRLKEVNSTLSDVIRSQFHLQEGDVTKAYDLLKPHLETNLRDAEFVLNFASTASRAGDSSTAMGAYLHVARNFGKSKFAQRAQFLSAVLSYQFQDYDGAEKRFSEFAELYPRTSLAREVRWHLAWLDCMREDFERSIARFKDLVKKNARSTSAVQRYEYWLAMSYLKSGKPQKAQPLFQKLASDPLRSYYALAAQGRLEKIQSNRSAKSTMPSARWAWSEYMTPSMEGTAPAVEETDEEEAFTSFVIDEEERDLVEEETSAAPTEEAEDPNISEIKTAKLAKKFETAQVLRSLGLNEWAKWENYSIERSTRNKEYLKALIQEYQRQGQFHRSSQIAHLKFQDERKRSGYLGARLYWEAAYPKAFEKSVEKWTRKESVPEEFVWAIMKQESQFEREAISPVGALGLMQVMPMTGYKMSRLRGQDDFTPQQLLSADPVIEIGTAYLRRLLKKFDQNYGLVAAAYNAGPHRVDLWVANFGSLSADEFIEHIPFAETRNYVKKVLSNMQIYRELYGTQKKLMNPLSESFSYKLKGPLSLKEEWETP
ncbi:MAG: transglycosylase SLT domain-containing protein [Bdellovibrionales bacterium]